MEQVWINWTEAGVNLLRSAVINSCTFTVDTTSQCESGVLNLLRFSFSGAT